MTCKNCGNEIKVKEAKFCPFCGSVVEHKVEIAPYTRAQFFNATGDDEFNDQWENLRSMSAEDVLSWLRENPPVHYCYKMFGEWCSYYDGKAHWWARAVYDNEFSDILSSKGGKIYPKKYKLSMQSLKDLGNNTFFTEQECADAINKAVEVEQEQHNDY